jgi:hypothetical protein
VYVGMEGKSRNWGVLVGVLFCGDRIWEDSIPFREQPLAAR